MRREMKGPVEIENIWIAVWGWVKTLVPSPKIACKWMFIPLKMVLTGIDPYPNEHGLSDSLSCFFYQHVPTLAAEILLDININKHLKCGVMNSVPKHGRFLKTAITVSH